MPETILTGPKAPLGTLRHPLVVALAGLALGALAQALFIGGQMSQRVKGVEAGLAPATWRTETSPKSNCSFPFSQAVSSNSKAALTPLETFAHD